MIKKVFCLRINYLQPKILCGYYTIEVASTSMVASEPVLVVTYLTIMVLSVDVLSSLPSTAERVTPASPLLSL